MYKKFLKRIFDLIVSLFAIILLLPVLIIISLLVLIFMGWPIIFKQPRPGYKNKIFFMYKFRTMTNKKDEKGNLLADELRLPKFGKFLRSTSLDELPELFCILFNKMSFIGPRPMLVRDMVFFDEEILKRQDVMPGLTGWAQANGRNALSWDDRFKYDLEYVNKVSFLMDLKVIFLTIKTVFKREGIGENGGELSIDYGDYLLKNSRISKEEYDKKQEHAKEIVNKLKIGRTTMKKYKIGYTTGVYDMFHIGHLNILKAAKEQCDYLIVGVSTDEVVQSYKHKTPIIPYNDRVSIIESIKYVDKVVPQEDMDKMKAWEKLKFNALFHGDDWKNTNMYNDLEEKLKKVNVDMVFLPHTDGISSTELSKKIKVNNEKQ